MVVLSYGYKKPVTGDRGSVWFPALEFDIQRLNDHTHNGTNSALLDSQSVNAISQDLAVSWTLVDTAKYRQTVTMPGTLQFNTTDISFRKTSDKSLLYLSAVRVGVNSFYVYTMDPTLDVTVIYG